MTEEKTRGSRQSDTLNAGWTIISALINGGAAELELSPNELAVLLQICRPCNNGHHVSFPLTFTIAKGAHVCERTVKRVRGRFKGKIIPDGARLITWEKRRVKYAKAGKEPRIVYDLSNLLRWAYEYHKRRQRE